jgi:phosphoribosylglycinamide formyltransferase-1
LAFVLWYYFIKLTTLINIAIFASGSGSNAQKIAEHFVNHSDIKIKLILSNNPAAFVLERAKNLNIQISIFNRSSFYNSEEVLDVLAANQIDFIVLAGFMWLVPHYLIKAYPDKIINIHPALLPKYGGKGMYGDHVHKAVAEAGESESGITIHFVNEHYDEGNIIFQAKCNVKNDTPEQIAAKVHALEYEYYPMIIEKCISK